MVPNLTSSNELGKPSHPAGVHIHCSRPVKQRDTATLKELVFVRAILTGNSILSEAYSLSDGCSLLSHKFSSDLADCTHLYCVYHTLGDP